MHEVLQSLPGASRVLDLGSGEGSFRAEDARHLKVVLADLERNSDRAPGVDRVQCSASALPFAAGAFSAAILNHSLEHFDSFGAALAEVGRVVRPEGALYIAVPDASTFADRLYRWLGRGGGHVNRFVDAAELARTIEAATGLQHRSTRTLCSSFSFLNRRNHNGRSPRRLLLFANGAEPVLRIAVHLVRLLDRALGTRLGMYGWALHFGNVPEIDTRTQSNVCVRCGTGHRTSLLRQAGAVRHGWFAAYRCQACGARNLLTADQS